MKPTKRQSALGRIKSDYAKNGRDTGEASRAFIESRLSYDAFLRARDAGMKIFNSTNKQESK